MQAGSLDELLRAAVERPLLDQLQVEVGRTLEDRLIPGLTGDDGKDRDLHVVDELGSHQRPVQRQAAGERNGTSDSSLSRATTSTASPRTTVASGQSRRASSVVDTTVAGMLRIRATHGVTHGGLVGGRAEQPHEVPIRVDAEDHPLRHAVQRKAPLEQLGALLALSSRPSRLR
jgi:hypothetical protein